MGFADRYLASVNSSNLLDDELHHATDALCAAAVADTTGAGFGALLSRVKYADGSINKLFESGTQNLAQLIRLWTNAVVEKGKARRWVRDEAIHPQIAMGLYKRVAEASLAHWLDSHCKTCAGTGVMAFFGNRACTACKGSRVAEVTGMREYERKLVLDMVSELTALFDSHARRASGLLRR